MKYNVEFYENANGESDVWNFLETLRIKSSTSKDARIQYKQLCLCIQLLENRIFYFYYKDNTFVLLHCFRKKSQKHLNKKFGGQNKKETTIYSERSYNYADMG